MNTFLDSFDEFVDDVISSDFILLNSELDLLIMQHLFHSIDLDFIKNIELQDIDNLAA